MRRTMTSAAFPPLLQCFLADIAAESHMYLAIWMQGRLCGNDHLTPFGHWLWQRLAVIHVKRHPDGGWANILWIIVGPPDRPWAAWQICVGPLDIIYIFRMTQDGTHTYSAFIVIPTFIDCFVDMIAWPLWIAVLLLIAEDTSFSDIGRAFAFWLAAGLTCFKLSSIVDAWATGPTVIAVRLLAAITRGRRKEGAEGPNHG